jgi:trimeric autotransporter adhesin
MKAKYFKGTLAIFLAIISSTILSQNLGINTTGAVPSTNAILDLNSGNKFNHGLIVPHVTLGTSLSTFSPPIANNATVKDTGMLVYNMNGTQSVGYYYWNGTSWINLNSGSLPGIYWALLGNAATIDDKILEGNFVGTTDAVALSFRVNNQHSGRIEFNTATGNTYFGYEAGNNGLTVLSTVVINGETNTNITPGNIGVFRIVFISSSAARLIRVN